MRRALALALAALVLVPAQASAKPQPTFPDELVDLAKRWIEEAEAWGSPSASATWYAEAAGYLANAKENQSAGRVRATMFHLETYQELVATGRVIDEAAALPSDAERKSFAIQRSNQWHAEALHAWAAYRERLHKLEPEIHALQAMELAMYSAENALGARLALDDHDLIARELPKQPSFSRDYLLALVRADHTSLQTIAWADDVLDLVGGREGVPPRLDEEVWQIEINATLVPLDGEAPSHLEKLEEIAGDVRANKEGVMSLMINLAEHRAIRATSIMVIFGDAQSRGKDVVTDAARGMQRQLNNTTVDEPQRYGLLGVFTADAIDRGLFTADFIGRPTLDLGVVIAAWTALDHAKYVNDTLAIASPISPPPEDAKRSPTPWVAALAALALVAIATRRTTGRR